METSILLAKVIGLVLVFISAALFFNKKSIDLLFSLYSHPESVLITGILEIGLGILFVLNHNIWTPDFRVIITVIGWMLLIRGLGRTFFPTKTTKWLEKFKKMKSVMTPLLVFIFVVGAFLAYSGFTR